MPETLSSNQKKEMPHIGGEEEVKKYEINELQKEFDTGQISKKKYEILEKHFSPKERINSLLEDIKSSRELAKIVGDEEKIPVEERMAERLAGISGSEFLGYSPENLRLIFTEGNTINFHGNRSAYRAIGAGNLIDRSTEYVKIDGIIGKRSQYGGGGYLNGKVGYVTVNGGYLGIDTGSKIENIKSDEIKPEERKEFERIQTLTEEEETKAKETFKENFKENEEIVKSGTRLGSGKRVEYPPNPPKQPNPIIKIGGSRSWRNNNPGNLEYGRFAKKHGAIGTDGRFAVFPSEEVGHKAKVALLKSGSYINKTIKGAILRYAPSFENNSAWYANTIAKYAGVSVDTKLNSLTEDQFNKLVKSMTMVEGWKEGRTETMIASVEKKNLNDAV